MYESDITHLLELNKIKAKVEEYERRAAHHSGFEAERRTILSQLTSPSQTPQLRDMGLYMVELRQHLQSVLDADLVGDSALKMLAYERCIVCSLRLLDLLPDLNKLEIRESLDVMELAGSTLAKLSSRPSLVPVILEASAPPILARSLSPLFPAAVVVSLAAAVGNMASNLDVRLSFRAHGGISALVRLLKPDVESIVQLAAAAALTLLAAQDLVVQDSVRNLGGIDLLMALMASSDTHLADVARNCLISLQHGNFKNEQATAAVLRASSSDGVPGQLHRLRGGSDSVKVRDLIADLDTLSARDTRDSAARQRPLTAQPLARSPSSSLSFRPETVASSTSRARTPIKLFDSGLQLPSSAATVRYPPAKTKDFSLAPSSPGGSTPTASPGGNGWTLGTVPVSTFEVEHDMLRRKHLARFSPEEVWLLLEELGFDSLDLRGFKLSRTSGSHLLTLSEEELTNSYCLVRSKARKVRQLQSATHLFDRIATLERQGRISEIELRLYLAGHGAGSSDVNKVIKLFRTLVRTDPYDFVTYWDFVTSFEWVSQAFRIYKIPA